MKIEQIVREDPAVLHLKGEFDTFHCPEFVGQIDALIAKGIPRVVLNMRMTAFINSTALGAIVKARKKLQAAGGDLVVSRPSPFVKNVFEKVGFDRIFRVFDDDEAAATHLLGKRAGEPGEGEAPDDEEERVLTQMAGGAVESGVEFTFGGKRSKVSATKAAAVFAPQGEVKVKFRLPLYKRLDFFEIPARIEKGTPEGDGTVRVRASFADIAEADRKAIRQFVEDMRFLKGELRSATGRA